ncbi:hypothetical protein RRSWK_03345 [Rhodopirellula sp. SWK7]|nr:hypothetical protein RRSWK_03345 [Rhodopirellula sp. SWK7]
MAGRRYEVTGRGGFGQSRLAIRYSFLAPAHCGTLSDRKSRKQQAVGGC